MKTVNIGNHAGTIATADLHLEPGDKIEGQCRRLIINGDAINILPWGLKAWLEGLGQITAWSISECATTIIIVVGNHEMTLQAAKKVFAKYENIIVVSSYSFDLMGRRCMFRHGHLFAPDWNFLSRFAPRVVSLMERNNKVHELWLWYCERMGWIGEKKKSRSSNTKKYNKWLWIVWRNAWEYLLKQDTPTTLYIGHTHPKEYCPKYFDDMGEGHNHVLRNIGAGEIIELGR